MDMSFLPTTADQKTTCGQEKKIQNGHVGSAEVSLGVTVKFDDAINFYKKTKTI